MGGIADNHSRDGQNRFQLEIGDEHYRFRDAVIGDATPIGAQVAAAAGFKPAQSTYVFQLLADGSHEAVRPDESVDLALGCRFLVIESDHANRLTLDGRPFDWPADQIAVAVLRELGQLPADRDLLLRRENQADRVLEVGGTVDLDRTGVEEFVTRPRTWKFRVQHVTLELKEPAIVVRDAIVRAGEDPDRRQQIFLSVAGQPRRKMALDDVIDLRTPGIEKLRLRPDDVNNGEATVPPTRDFALLQADEAYLDRIGLRWETVAEGACRWLLIHRYPLPSGYTATEALLALMVPPSYPAAQVYGFYAHPPLALASGKAVQGTLLSGSVRGLALVGWSRYRPAWDPAKENVVSHLTLVDAALDMELGE